MRLLVNHWSPLTHASHCMTTSRSAAARQMRMTVSPAMHPNFPIFTPDVLPACHQPSLFLGLDTGSEYAALYTETPHNNNDNKIFSY